MNSYVGGRLSGTIQNLGRETFTIMLFSVFLMLMVMGADVNLSVEQMTIFERFLVKYVGIAWPFFMMTALFIIWAFGAWVVEFVGVQAKRNWTPVVKVLDWATEACPYVGLITTFFTFLNALVVYSRAGPGDPETQKAFIGQFAIAFGSSITGGILALIAFTLVTLINNGEK
jgi:hypothetical protein